MSNKVSWVLFSRSRPAFMFFFRFLKPLDSAGRIRDLRIIHFYLCFSQTIPIRPPPFVLSFFFLLFSLSPYHFVPFSSIALYLSQAQLETSGTAVSLINPKDRPPHRKKTSPLPRGSEEIQSTYRYYI